MTPDRRLDQIEQVMADVLQKVNRLLDGQGQLVELIVDTKAEVTGIKTEVSGIKTEVSGAKTEIAGVRTEVSATKATVSKIEATGEITANGLAKLTLTVHDLRDEIRERFDRTEQTQQEILTLLRERLL